MISKFVLFNIIIYNVFNFSFALCYTSKYLKINSLETIRNIVIGTFIVFFVIVTVCSLTCCIYNCKKHGQIFYSSQQSSTRLPAPNGEHFQVLFINNNARNESADLVAVNNERQTVKPIEDNPPSYDELFTTNEHKWKK